MVQILNNEQKESYYHVLHLLKASDETSYCFLVGRAGVGKSLVTKALYQAASKYYHYTRAGVDFHEAKVLMPAPTGKAAYNIKANTIYTALQIAAFHAIVGSWTTNDAVLETEQDFQDFILAKNTRIYYWNQGSTWYKFEYSYYQITG